MSYNIDEILKSANLLIRDKPCFFPKTIPETKQLLSWNSVNDCLNNPLFEMELIDKNNKKIDIPKVIVPWVMTPVNDKSFVAQKIGEGYGFVIKNYGFYNKNIQLLLMELEQTFNVMCDVHVYGGLVESKSFKIHDDFPANIIIQIEGETRWKVFSNRASMLHTLEETHSFDIDENELEKVIDVVLKPGDMLYIPSRCYHVAMPQSTRLSISIPCWPREHNQYSRQYYEIKP
jgi:hypothetical protein